MKTHRINHVIVGLFVIAMISVLLVAVALLTGRTGDVASYHTLFDNVGGVKSGTKVLFEGYPVGQVEAIRPVRDDNQTRFRVEMSLMSDWQIPRDSIARLATPGLLAAITINITGGESSEVLVQGDRIPSIQGGDVFAIIGDVATEVLDLSQNRIKPLLGNVNRLVETLGDAGEPAMVDIAENLRQVVADIAESTPVVLADIESFSATMDATAGRVGGLLTEERVAQIDNMLADMEATAGNFADLSGDLNDSRAQLSAAIEEVSTMLQDNRGDLTESFSDLRYVLDSLARHVDAVAYNLEGTSRNMLEFSRQVRQNPGVLIRGTTPEEDDSIAPALRRAVQ